MSAIHARQLDEYAEELLKLVRPCVHLSRRRTRAGALTPADSFLGGGFAFMAPGEEWPMSGRWAMEPLASIRLADAAACDASGLLPRRGRLTFWFDMEEQPDGILPEDRSGFRVTYTADDVAPLERRSPPALTWAKRKPNDSLAACRLSFAPGLSLPVWDQLPADLMERIDSLRYTDLMCDLDGDAIHRLLGYPMVLHRAVEPICQYASNGLRCGSADSLDEDRARAMEEGIADWILLLQLDTDEDEGPGWMWGDAGVLHYSIRRQDLAQSRFDGCWLTWECC